MANKKLACILGNGFTIDFINHINKTKCIDVSNLFRLGSQVPWPPTNVPGFLSFKHCPNLWNLGARPNMSGEEAMSLIEDIITCVNVYASRKNPLPITEDKPNDIYIKGYQELSEYLRHLFIYYNEKITTFPSEHSTWSWLKFLQSAFSSAEIEEINIISYNYDIWLERVLIESNIPFNVAGFDTASDAKICIFKPHGSISFVHNISTDIDSYTVKYREEILSDTPLSDFSVKYQDLQKNYLASALIPPAGESGRLDQTWARELKELASDAIERMTDQDEMIICGLSYWHVDRAEIDELLIKCSPNVDLTLVNPNPDRTLDAVLTSIFTNLVVYTSSKILEDRISV